MGGTGLIDNYLKWVSDAVRILRTTLRSEDLKRLVLTDRYWATLTNSMPSAPIIAAVNDEVLARQTELDATLTELDQQLSFWIADSLRGPVRYVVIDTNVLLHHPNTFMEIPWHEVVGRTVRSMDNIRIVLPLLVIDELDDAKREQVRTRARQTLKTIYGKFTGGVQGQRVVQPASVSLGAVSVQLLLDPPYHVRLPRPDDEIVDRAVALQSFLGEPVDFVSYDTGAVLRAEAAGLRQHKLDHT